MYPYERPSYPLAYKLIPYYDIKDVLLNNIMKGSMQWE